MGRIELDEFVNFKSVEYAYARSIKERDRHNQAFGELGLRVAKARDPKLLMVLDKAANVMIKEDDKQRGQTRHTSENESERRYTTETQMWREAYRMVDEGKAAEVPHLMWIYAAAAFLCGYQL
jgi:hypothetical protein